jgi:hypothetical protein
MQESQLSGLFITGIRLRLIPAYGLPDAIRFNSLSRQVAFFTRARRQAVSKFGTEGQFMARKLPDSRPGTSMFDNSLVHQYSSFLTKKAFIFPIRGGRREPWCGDWPKGSGLRF